jgi:hypothetical protein
MPFHGNTKPVEGLMRKVAAKRPFQKEEAKT